VILLPWPQPTSLPSRRRWFASGLSNTPRIAQGGKPPQGITAIDPVMHQEAFDEGAHLVLRVPSLNVLGPSPPAAAAAKNAPPVERGILTRPRSHQTRVCAAGRTTTILLRFRAIR
jgi:hypothetical protein